MPKTKLFDDIPMIDVTPVNRPKEAQKRTPTAGTAWCPGCRFTNTRAFGVTAENGHYVWRRHRKTTWSGASIECASSGTRLCVVRPLNKSDSKIVACTCEDVS